MTLEAEIKKKKRANQNPTQQPYIPCSVLLLDHPLQAFLWVCLNLVVEMLNSP